MRSTLIVIALAFGSLFFAGCIHSRTSAFTSVGGEVQKLIPAGRLRGRRYPVHGQPAAFARRGNSLSVDAVFPLSVFANGLAAMLYRLVWFSVQG